MRADQQSPQPQPTRDEVRIVYRGDGSAAVNDVPVAVQPGQDVRDAAYRAAVELAMVLGATGPVVAMSVEPDGAVYPVTLYPAPSALGGADPAAASLGAAGAFHRVRRAWYRPTLSVSWLAAAACACVLLSVLATVLLREGGPSVVRFSVDTENAAGHSPTARSAGRAISTTPGVLRTESVRALARKAAAAEPDGSPTAARQHASKTPMPGAGLPPAPGLPPQPSNTAATTSPRPSPTPTSAKAVAVTNLALALVGGDQSDDSIAYLATVWTSDAAPVTFTYRYAGSQGRGAVSRTVTLSGHTEYVLGDLIPAKPYCGGPVTMSVWTSPGARNGTVTATAQPGC